MSDEPQDVVAPKRRGGSKKGRKFQRVKREAGDELHPHNFLLLDSEIDVLKRYGASNATRGLRELIRVAKALEDARRR